MIQIQIKIWPGIGSPEGKWELLNFDDFLLKHSPDLRMCVLIGKQFPPFHIINEALQTGGSDQGMSGGCFWKPFKLTEQEYAEISEEMLSSPSLDLEYDKDLENLSNLKKWQGAVLAKIKRRN